MAEGDGLGHHLQRGLAVPGVYMALCETKLGKKEGKAPSSSHQLPVTVQQ